VYLRDRGWDFRDLPNLRQRTKTIRWDLRAQLDADEHGHGGGEYRYAVALRLWRYLGVDEELLTWAPPGQSPGEPLELLRRKGRKASYLNRATGVREEAVIPRLPASVMSTWDPHRDRQKHPQALRFRQWVERFRSYLIWDPKVLRNPDRGRYEEMGQSGEHLAAVLGRLKERSPASFTQLVTRLRRLFPTLSDITVSGRGWGRRTVRLHEGDGTEVVFNSQQMSDGVLRLLAVTSLLHLDRIPSVITFEEPENGVHPQLLREVVQTLRELTQRKAPNRCQVFLTTHSPYVLDEFFDHPEQVYCMERPHPQAGAKIIRLSENRQLNVVRESFRTSLGEAWFTGLLGAASR